jgi:hypothetical protein
MNLCVNTAPSWYYPHPKCLQMKLRVSPFTIIFSIVRYVGLSTSGRGIKKCGCGSQSSLCLPC